MRRMIERRRAINIDSKIISRCWFFIDYYLKRAWLEVRYPRPLTNARMDAWAEYIDKTRELNGSKGFYIERVGKYEIRTPWLPMLRVQLRSFFKLQEYDFDLPDSPVIVDLGANIGVGSLYFHERYRPRKLVTVEADPYLYEMFLEPNMRANRIPCELINKACSSSSERHLRFKSTGLDSGHLAIDGDIIVETITLDEILSEYSEVDLLKVDVEGAEFDILLNCRGIRKINNLYVEVEYQAGSAKPYGRLVSYLQDLGYEVVLRASMPKSSPKRSFSSEVGTIVSYVHIYARYTGSR